MYELTIRNVKKMINSSERKWKPDADRAWQLLYAHLEADDLVPIEEKSEKNRRVTAGNRKVTILFRWSAAALLCAICVGIAILYWPQTSSVEMIAIQNTNDYEILVSTLKDGTIVYLYSGGKITYPRSFAPNQRNVTLEGDAFFHVNSNKHSPFVIQTKQITVEVVGTSFRIRADKHLPFELAVKSGIVKARLNDEEHGVFVEAGEQVQLVSNWLQKTYIENIDVLTKGVHRLCFKDEPLGQIVQIVNECISGTKSLSLEHESLAERMITVTFDVDSPQSVAKIAELLCETLDLKQTIVEDIIIICKK